MNAPWQQRGGYAAWALLALLQILWHAVLAPPARGAGAAAAVLALLPLLLPLLYWRVPARALLLAGMLALFYFCHGVAVAWAEPSLRALAVIELLLALALVLANARKPRRRGKGSKLPSS